MGRTRGHDSAMEKKVGWPQKSIHSPKRTNPYMNDINYLLIVYKLVL